MIFGLFVRKIRKIGGQNSRKRARMVLQNVNNQLFSPFSRLKPAKLPDSTRLIRVVTIMVIAPGI
jgi:hypothetical protein